MLVRVKKNVVVSVLALASAVISLPTLSHAATSPAVAVLSPMAQGLRAPVKVVLDLNGNSYVADQRVGGIVKLDAYGAQVKVIRTESTPSGIAFAQDGSLLVGQGAAVVRYDVVTGQEVGRLTGGGLKAASGIAVDDVTGYVYVADSSANQVEVYTASGVFVKAFGKGFNADASGASYDNPLGALSMPTGVAFEKVSRQVAVADTLGHRIQFFDVDGNFVKSVGNTIPATLGASVGSMQFFSPVAIAFEYGKGATPSLERMYIVDSYQGVVQVVDPTTLAALAVSGAANNMIGSSGVANGQLMVPSDVVFDALNSRLLVVNGFGNVSIFGIDGGANPVYVAPPTPVEPPPVVVVAAPALTVAPVVSLTQSGVVTVSGTVDAGSSVVVANQANATSGTAAVVGTSWSMNVTLAEGGNNLTVTAQKGNSEKANAALSVTLDTTSPTLVVSALPNGSNASDPVQNISGAVADMNGATVTVNGVAAALSGNGFSVPVTLVNGANTITVVATDAVGNKTVEKRDILFNALSLVTVSEPVDNLITTAGSLKLTGTTDGNSTVTVGGVPATVQGTSWTAQATLATGLNTIQIVATDALGATASVKRTITLDTDKPALAVAAPAQDVAVNTPNYQISGVVADATTIALEYSVNGSAVPVPVVAGAYSFNVDFAAEGTYPVTVVAKDAAGNSSTIVRNVIYDVTPPAFTLAQVNGVMPEKLSGTVEPGSAVVVKDGTNVIGAVQIANGSWSANLAGVTYNPDSLIAIATDAAGNSTSKSLSYNFPDGTLNATGKPTVQDALRAIRIVVNQTAPSAAELGHYDIGPLVGGKPNPNGKIEIVDAILILRKALGLKSW